MEIDKKQTEIEHFDQRYQPLLDSAQQNSIPIIYGKNVQGIFTKFKKQGKIQLI